MLPHLARQRQQLERLGQRERRFRQVRRNRCALRLRRLRALFLLRRLAQLHVGAEAARHQIDGLPRRRVGAERTRPLGLRLQQFDRLFDGEVGGCDVLGNRRRIARSAFAALHERTVAADADADRLVVGRVESSSTAG